MTTNPRRRRRWWQAGLFVAFVVMPVAEIYVLIQVGQVIGAWWTVLLLILSGLVGSWLIRHEGRRAFEGLRAALDSGRMPAEELADGILILVGGTLMLAPGFITDAMGALLILPFTRPLARRVLGRVVARRLVVIPGGATWTQGRQGPGPGSEGDVVRGEVVD